MRSRGDSVRSKLRGRLTYANVVATLALFIALGGGAYAAATIGAADIKDDAVRSRHIADGQVQRAHLAPSARDSCPAGTVRRGRLCARSPNSPTGWFSAVGHCESLGLRLPGYSEGRAMASKHNVPGTLEGESFWVDSYHDSSGTSQRSWTVREDGGSLSQDVNAVEEVVCVTTPSN